MFSLFDHQFYGLHWFVLVAHDLQPIKAARQVSWSIDNQLCGFLLTLLIREAEKIGTFWQVGLDAETAGAGLHLLCPKAETGLPIALSPSGL